MDFIKENKKIKRNINRRFDKDSSNFLKTFFIKDFLAP